jgi:hypothetical protein
VGLPLPRSSSRHRAHRPCARIRGAKEIELLALRQGVAVSDARSGVAPTSPRPGVAHCAEPNGPEIALEPRGLGHTVQLALLARSAGRPTLGLISTADRVLLPTTKATRSLVVRLAIETRGGATGASRANSSSWAFGEREQDRPILKDEGLGPTPVSERLDMAAFLRAQAARVVANRLLRRRHPIGLTRRRRRARNGDRSGR